MKCPSEGCRFEIVSKNGKLGGIPDIERMRGHIRGAHPKDLTPGKPTIHRYDGVAWSVPAAQLTADEKSAMLAKDPNLVFRRPWKWYYAAPFEKGCRPEGPGVRILAVRRLASMDEGTAWAKRFYEKLRARRTADRVRRAKSRLRKT